jgi:hypothetical protein
MVCYGRSTIGFVIAVVAVLVAFGGGAVRFLDVHALALSLAVVFGVAAVAAVGAFAAVRAIQHRRARAGGCVGCTYRCQHAMTGPLTLVRVIDRQAAPVPVALPMPKVRIPEPKVRIPEPRPALDIVTAPQWPDRPALATAVKVRDH